jgi:hypothetical protein
MNGDRLFSDPDPYEMQVFNEIPYGGISVFIFIGLIQTDKVVRESGRIGFILPSIKELMRIITQKTRSLSTRGDCLKFSIHFFPIFLVLPDIN